ncbi:hypothetical protein KUCAC02_014788 [Chaenocephalus aceratus]|uniref:Uncharacterized protein n=1 Tax=Chaenocephalus aceratus TaxID=36190 RepID=A0ACB9WFH8_CHAAC|nr:hypothetical protein KUCAC02_014788 [Chaenocephalus aceratus]
MDEAAAEIREDGAETRPTMETPHLKTTLIHRLRTPQMGLGFSAVGIVEKPSERRQLSWSIAISTHKKVCI